MVLTLQNEIMTLLSVFSEWIFEPVNVLLNPHDDRWKSVAINRAGRPRAEIESPCMSGTDHLPGLAQSNVTSRPSRRFSRTEQVIIFVANP
jgi:hypothetical protein